MAEFQTYELSEGDESDVDLTCKDDDGSIIDITNASPITFHWKHAGLPISTKVAAVQDGPNGVARFSTETTDILATDLLIQVETTINTKTRRSDPVLFRVNPKLT